MPLHAGTSGFDTRIRQVGRPRSKVGRLFTDQTSDLICRFSTQPTAARALAIDTMIRSLITAVVWWDLDCLQVYAAADQQASLVDWRVPGRVGTISDAPTFTTDRGFTFDGVNDYVNTNYIPSGAGNVITGTDQMIAVYERTNVATTTTPAGAHNANTRRIVLVPRSAGNQIQAGINSVNVSVTSSITDSRGLTAVQFDGTNDQGFKNGAAGSSVSAGTVGTSLASVAVFVGAHNIAGSPTTPRASEIALVAVGRRLSTQEHTDFYNAVQAYMTSVGANV